MNKKQRKGISLIVLVITIIVIIILAGSVILSLSANNPIAQATEAKFKTNANEYNSELTLAIANKYAQGIITEFDSNSINLRSWNGVEAATGTIKELVTSITATDGPKYEIQAGKLVYVGSVVAEQGYITSMGLSNKTALGINVIATVNSTVNGLVATYSNPIVPKGFKAVTTTDANWTNVSTDWNKGLVIEDTSGNQFVWVPVDGTNVTYSKWCTTNISYASTTDDTLPSGVTAENTQIANYGGFYIARYEAGNSSNVLVSKQNIAVWNNINYTNSKIKAESMYNTVEVKSGLLSGKQWDTVMKWLQNASINVTTDSTAWGNYHNATFTYEFPISGTKAIMTSVLLNTGAAVRNKTKNIYDLAGNTWEWTNEIYGTNRIFRGGGYDYGGSGGPAAFRYYDTASYTFSDLAFRVVLYIL
jgi:Tfp pilus assembly protein PilE